MIIDTEKLKENVLKKLNEMEIELTRRKKLIHKFRSGEKVFDEIREAKVAIVEFIYLLEEIQKYMDGKRSIISESMLEEIKKEIKGDLIS